MSSDFLNFIVALPAKHARLYFERLQGAQRPSDLIGPDEQTLFRVTPGGSLDLTEVRRAYDGARPAPPEYGMAYVNVDPTDLLDELTRDGLRFACELSMGDTTLAAIDRVLALPRGVPLLEGQGLARLRPKRRARVRRAWTRLIERLGGPRGAAAALRPYLRDHGEYAAVREVIREVTRTLVWADGRECDVLLLVTPT